MGALREIVTALTIHPGFRRTPIVCKGGTRMALGYGLPRPSTDLDLACGGAVDKAQVLEVAVAAITRERHRTVVRADIKQRGHGYLRLHWVDEAAAAEVQTSMDVQTNDPLAVPDNAIIRHGFRTFDLKTMARSKLSTLVGKRPRIAARDLYDAAWLMERHMEAVHPNERIALWETIHVTVLDRADEWTRLFRTDDILSRSSLDQVWDSLEASLAHDPLVLLHRDPEGTLNLKDADDGPVLVFSGNVIDDQTIGAFESREAVQLWLCSIDPEGRLPELIRD